MIVLQQWNKKNKEVKLHLICMAIILMLQCNKLETRYYTTILSK